MFLDGEDGETNKLIISNTPEVMFFINLCFLLAKLYPNEVDLCSHSSLQPNVT